MIDSDSDSDSDSTSDSTDNRDDRHDRSIIRLTSITITITCKLTLTLTTYSLRPLQLNPEVVATPNGFVPLTVTSTVVTTVTDVDQWLD